MILYIYLFLLVINLMFLLNNIIYLIFSELNNEKLFLNTKDLMKYYRLLKTFSISSSFIMIIKIF